MIVDPTERFEALVDGPEPSVPLDEAMFVIANHSTPTLDVPAQLARLDDLAAQCSSDTLEGLARHLFAAGRFTGNQNDYYDPDNSFLDRVLDRRLGIPISLSVLAIEVGRRVGVPLVGVGLPGHFIVRSATDSGVFLDPFGGGALLDRAGCIELFRSVMSSTRGFDDSMLEPVGTFAVLTRVLTNLEHIYGRRADTETVAWVRRLLVAIPGSNRVTERSGAMRRMSRWN
jgi:regulator of sirC expression with transglutaminase-like and TPR domain